MESITIRNAYYVKLGKGGEWAEDSIQRGMIRIGWREQTLDDVNHWRESIIREKTLLAREQEGLPTAKTAVSNDLSALNKIVHSTPEDVWITFHRSYLWWCRVAETEIKEDVTSKFRNTARQWSHCDVEGTSLIINQIPGRLTKIQRFSGTICSLGTDEVNDLRRLLNNQPSVEFQSISSTKATLIRQVESGLSLLHWKDFEILVDLIFRNAGWRRVSVVGESMKSVDMELEEPITHELYQVQVKSDATIANFREYAEQFTEGDFRKLYFVVHNSEEKWANAPKYKNVELILQEQLAQMVVDSGLVNWLLKRIR
jgi:hypothetical protein